MSRFTLPPILESMSSIVNAEFDRDGRVLRGNAGFFRCLPNGGEGLSAWDLLANPRFDFLLQAEPDDDGRLFEGLLTFGDPGGITRTLQGALFREGERLHLVAGYDIEELENAASQLLDLNRALETTQRELARSNRELERREEAIRKLSLTDALTGVGNRRHLDETLAAEVARARRHDTLLSLVMLDIDHFKQINDTWGHEAGDLVLREIGAMLRGMLRQSDSASRLGGEEFVVLLPATGIDDAMTSAERMRCALAERRIGALPRITASFGIASLLPGETATELLARADAALYAAKHTGRNRVMTSALP